MAGTRITQLTPGAIPGRNYGDFTRAALPPVALVTCGEWSTPVAFEVCDEWYVTFDGAAMDTPKVRVTIRYS